MKNLLFENIISKFAKPYSEKSNATRCRCVLLNKDCDKVAMIKRIKPDEEEMRRLSEELYAAMPS